MFIYTHIRDTEIRDTHQACKTFQSISKIPLNEKAPA